jgi:hypothetical protein
MKPKSAQTTRYNATNNSTAPAPLPVRLKTAGTAPGNIIAAIIGTHIARKNPNEPRRVATPMSIPIISRSASAKHAAASPSVAVSAVTVDALPVFLRGPICILPRILSVRLTHDLASAVQRLSYSS